uniref:Peroxisomal multifunctional enzyme type 2 n=1 Tax=Nyssomyia neivai TaxID=330878 RepID=A0A1L8DZ43_9DIPT
MSQLRFDGRVVIVTGAGAGLGREYALLFASRGAKVVVNDLGGDPQGKGKSQKAADVVVDEIRAMGGVAVADYHSVTDGEKIVQTAMENFGRIDVLVNNAGILRDKSFPRISEEDWNLIHDVHVKGSFKTTQAAFPIFKKQNFGRIIMTSSNSGVYGNFGQANYSAAKLGLVGLANTIAIEGAKYNIHCNVIVPTAASRMTQGILPEQLFKELKPKLIAPVVVYLCHENTEDNGAVIASAAGWAGKVEIYAGKGSVLRTSLHQDVTIENVRDAWSKVLDMTAAQNMKTSAAASAKLMTILDQLDQPSGQPSGNTNQSNGVYENEFTFGYKDLILYALGIGASVNEPSDLKYLYESHEEFSVLPSYFIQPGLMLTMGSSITKSAITHKEFDLTNVLHGEQYLEVYDFPLEGNLRTEGKVIDVMDKGSGAVVVTCCETFDNHGNLVAKNQSSTFIVGCGNFGGKKNPSPEVIPTLPTPTTPPETSITLKTSVDQAAIFRLSGDANPLHIDPNFSIIAGYKTPILHGLCTLGFSLRAVLKTYANNDATLFKAIKVRFVKPVIPGQTLKVDMWQNGNRIQFKTSVVETGQDVLTGAYVDLTSTVKVEKAIETSSNMGLQSDAIFGAIKDRVNDDQAKAKSVNGVFAYKITENGKVVKEWTLDLKSAKVYEGAPQGVKADTTLTVADTDFVDIAMGKINPQVAFMKGKLKIAGNIMLTQKLVPFLKTDSKL